MHRLQVGGKNKVKEAKQKYKEFRDRQEKQMRQLQEQQAQNSKSAATLQASIRRKAAQTDYKKQGAAKILKAASRRNKQWRKPSGA